MLNDIVKPLTEWYRQNKRSLPWRDRHNAYYTWVSEIMLQQTRVEAVKPYFRRFTEELPDPAALAECPEEKLLKLWEGLGYYNRVRNMQIAAQTVVEEYDGVLPASYEKLLSLKGIGSYTAGAIASIAYDIPVPAVDGNVLRVITRIIEDDGDIMKQSVKKRIENKLQEIMPGECPGDFNQALMELGAVVCVPNGEPKCDVCPVAFCCGARAHGTIDRFPVKAQKKDRKLEDRTVLVIQDGEKTAIRRRPSRGLLAGLYELPNLKGHLSEEEVLESLGDPRLIARTIIQTNGGDNRSGYRNTVYGNGEYREAAGSTVHHSYNGDGNGEYGTHRSKMADVLAKLPVWVWIILGILVVVLVISAVFSVLSFLAPVLIPILVVLFLVKLFRDWLN